MEKYNESIAPEATYATAPEELHPVAAAFGGDIGKALQATGEQVASRMEQLGQYAARMNYYRGQQAVADKVLQMKNDQNSLLFGNPDNPSATVTKTRTPVDALTPSNTTFSAGGAVPSNTIPVAQLQTYEVPAGILQRQGNQAHGALQDYHDWYQSYSKQVVDQARNEGLGEGNIKSLKIKLDADFATNSRYIARHEAVELDKAQQQTFLKGMQLDANNAVTRQDPISLSRTIDSINQQNQVLNDSQGKSADDPIRELTSNKFVSQALNNSMATNLKETGGNPDQFQATLDKLHDDGKINDTVYQNAQTNLDKVSKSITGQNVRAAKVQSINTTLGYVNQVVEGKLDFTNPNVINEIRANSPTAGAAIDNYVLNKSVDVPQSDEAIAHSVDELYKTGSKEEITKFNLGLMSKFPNGIPQAIVNTMMMDGIERAKRVSDLAEAPMKPDAVQIRIDGGMQALQRWNKIQGSQDGQSYIDYMKNIHSQMSPTEAYNSAVKTAVIRKNPAVASLPVTPNYVIGKDSPIRYVFPRTNRKNDGKSDTK